jgi:hypothetical protein
VDFSRQRDRADQARAALKAERGWSEESRGEKIEA